MAIPEPKSDLGIALDLVLTIVCTRGGRVGEMEGGRGGRDNRKSHTLARRLTHPTRQYI